MKNILITGGCGFIGSNFVKNIVNAGEFHPIIIDKLTYAGNVDNLKNIQNSEYTFIKGDICDEKTVLTVFNDYNFNAVFHFAAESHVDRSIDGPKDFINTNIIGTYNLLQGVREVSKKLSNQFKFIHVSTDEVYGDLKNDGFFKETTPYKLKPT